MVFYQIATGICVGMMIPQMVNHQLYMFIANSFVRPHLRLRMYFHEKHRDAAIDTNFLGSYLKDVFGSFFMFLILLGPQIKLIYFSQGEKIKKDENNVPILEDDQYTKILKNIKAKELKDKLQLQQESQTKQIDIQGQNTDLSKQASTVSLNQEKQRITFEDYERLFIELEKQGKLEQLEKQNPRSYMYQGKKI